MANIKITASNDEQIQTVKMGAQKLGFKVLSSGDIYRVEVPPRKERRANGIEMKDINAFVGELALLGCSVEIETE